MKSVQVKTKAGLAHDRQDELALYRQIFASSNDGIAIIDAQGCYLAQNASHRELIGYADEELEGMTPAIHLGEETFAQIAARLQAEGAYRGEVVSRTRRGPLDIELSAFSIRNEAGEVLAYVGIKRDISQLKRIERALRQRLAQMQVLYELKNVVIRAEDIEEIYSAALTALMQGLAADRASILLLDSGGVMRFKAWRGLSAPYRAAVEGHSPWRSEDSDPRPILIEDAVVDQGLDAFREIVLNEGLRALAFIPLLYKGRLLGKFMLYYDAPHCFEESEVRFAQTVAGTIATSIGRKYAEEELRRSHHLLSAIVDGTIDVVFMKDLEGRYIMVNPAGAQAMGLPAQEIVGRRDEDLFAPETARQNGEEDAQVMRGRELRTVRELTTAAGLKGTFLVTKTPSLDSAGQVAGIIGIAHDVTERKRREDDLAKAQRLESIGLLAGGIAHDFNNILTAVFGNISLARLFSDPGDRVNEVLVESERAIAQARDLTQQLLTFSRGGAPITKTASIVELLQETAVFCLRGSNVRCEFALAGDLLPACIDPGQISQVVNNLIINAQQAMPAGGLIRIGAENILLGEKEHPSLRPGRYIKVTVADQGVGIPPEHLPKVFDPYFTTKHTGSGLGLATGYSIVKRHDGHIEVESEPGCGAVFTLYLPASPEAAPAEAPAGTWPARGQGRLLLMDDEQTIRRVGQRLLEHLGFEVAAAADGAEAVALCAQAKADGRPFDIAILDLTVPGGMGGRECMQKLREVDPGIMGIVSSGYFNDPVMAEFRAFAFSGVVGKPYQLEEIKSAVERLMAERP